MFQIIADSLLIAARVEPLRNDAPRAQPDPESDRKARRRWFSLAGVRL